MGNQDVLRQKGAPYISISMYNKYRMSRRHKIVIGQSLGKQKGRNTACS
jgi:hypothetical protein